ncbi:dTDP-4-amino-4,6-dideoxygalactose transaminase [Hymenobacter daecheongensis DSM 21074]|uniref:dTDP-4-amino-4,6-dideoxygalactose transaminase n=1 Tax=Hymenobacter daecheongensis DSM 21074 TaxID=1121955 RepID=A0A1M6GFH0_9BACT|nr:dTDP-4-amino-4,6-dideoxygalactose transaminase [Hymenobacter daecheongensis]SHJ08667.1 dTDP-4-amino-4,6-dideoxygalactose transaminase [Hymenobacter daecheongensis DSM 21074]
MYPTHIPFNKPYLSGNETRYIEEAVRSGKISGDGMFTKRCHRFFEQELGFKKVLLTTSCTDALEMAAMLLDIVPGDEVIMPSYTFVSTPNAFVLRGATIVFADSTALNPNMDPAQIEALITPRTRAIVPVHYAGIACDLDPIMEIANRHNLFVIEDAAQAIDSFYKGRQLGTIGHLAAFSFHETKNIISGEGGMLAINDLRFFTRAEIIREKGTNRSSFFRGEIDKYGWVDYGSSFLPSDIIAAFLWAQLENMADIQSKRTHIWERYYQALSPLLAVGVQLPAIPDYATNNGHMFYLVCRSLAERTALIELMRTENVQPVFHYLSLHTSSFYADKHDGRPLPHSDHYTDCLLRLPLYYELKDEDQDFVNQLILGFYQDTQKSPAVFPAANLPVSGE